jgi:hypothetical protein
MNGVIDGGVSCCRTKLGGENDGDCGANNVNELWSAGPPRVIVLATMGMVNGACAAGNDTHGTTTAGITGATKTGVAMLTVLLFTPVTPSTAPAGSELTSRKILAMANAINGFTLITIPSLVTQYSTH